MFNEKGNEIHPGEKPWSMERGMYLQNGLMYGGRYYGGGGGWPKGILQIGFNLAPDQ